MSLSPALIWFIVGVVFIVIELLVPGLIFIFFAAGAWIAGLSVWMLDVGLTTQIVIFIIASLVLLFTLRKYSMETFKGNKKESMDDNYADSKIGKQAVVTKSISSTQAGEIKVQGSFWRAVADADISEGAAVVIESQESEDGLTFKVKQA